MNDSIEHSIYSVAIQQHTTRILFASKSGMETHSHTNHLDRMKNEKKKFYTNKKPLH